tara:strand:+ start:3181 stop:4107 length:927 start_codon:yes stop_codon:yes gene_type:complete
MSSLRDLLDVPDTNVVPIQTYMGGGQHQLYYRGNHCWEFGSSYNYDWQRIRWCVPNSCICKVKFELWGGGGGGSGTCCCSIAWNGFSGQYSSCTVCAAVQSVSQLDGCCYDICVAGGTCRHPSRGGFDGCKSYVDGPGLSDFCACGGCHGWNCCHWVDSYFSCRTRIHQCGPACCRQQTEHYTLASSDCMDSCEEKGKWYWNGLSPYIHYDCNPGCGNWCMKKDYHPNPPMYGARYGVVNATRKCSMATCGRTQTLWLTGNNGGLSGDCWRNGPPGSGGTSAQVFGGGCCCSSEGAHGLVRITLFCKT